MEDKLKQVMTFPEVTPPRVSEQQLRRRTQQRWERLQLQLLCLMSCLWTVGLCAFGWSVRPIWPEMSLFLAVVALVVLPAGGGVSALLLRHYGKEKKI